MNAVGKGDLEIVRLLIDKGADVNVQAKYGSTALIMSQYAGRDREEIVRLLKEGGAQK
jgi:ankyrin repeat protein